MGGQFLELILDSYSRYLFYLFFIQLVKVAVRDARFEAVDIVGDVIQLGGSGKNRKWGLVGSCRGVRRWRFIGIDNKQTANQEQDDDNNDY